MREPSFEHVAGKARSLLFVCDHASNAVPDEFGTLGLEPSLLSKHIAYDIGAADVTRALARTFGVPAILARWSRLVVDLNRGIDDPTLVMKISDGTLIPGNASSDDEDMLRRVERFHRPYHAAIEDAIAGALGKGVIPSIVSIHSFTPVWKGMRRPWEVGVLWDRDDRLARPLLSALRSAGFTVGDNQPYSGELENDCLYVHGTMNGLPHALIEIRQDLISTPEKAETIGLRLKTILTEALTEMGQARIGFSRPLARKHGVSEMEERTRLELEAAVFERLVAHLRERTDVQNIDMMALAGFCRNCLGDWYREAAAAKGIALDKDAARELIYGMPPGEWKARYQKEATPEQQAAFEKAQKTHSHGS